MSARQGRQKVSLARRDMAGLRAVLDGRSDFSDFAGHNVLGCVTVTPETGVLVLSTHAAAAGTVVTLGDPQGSGMISVVDNEKDINSYR